MLVFYSAQKLKKSLMLKEKKGGLDAPNDVKTKE